jgi:hypothetical protein
VRKRSYSRLLTMEAARLLKALGAEPRIFDPSGLPLPDSEPVTHPKVAELRQLAEWSEGMVWCSPERHGAMTGVMKAQIDWIPLTEGSVRPTQGKTLAVMEVKNIDESIRFYTALFATEPTVRKDDYAKWMLEDPRINFATISIGAPIPWVFPGRPSTPSTPSRSTAMTPT